MPKYTPGDDQWAVLSAAVANLIIQPFGEAEILFAAALPAPSDTGFSLQSGEIALLPGVNAFGANTYIRFKGGIGSATYQKS